MEIKAWKITVKCYGNNTEHFYKAGTIIGTLQILTHLIHNAAIWSAYYYYTYVTNKETEA